MNSTFLYDEYQRVLRIGTTSKDPYTVALSALTMYNYQQVTSAYSMTNHLKDFMNLQTGEMQSMSNSITWKKMLFNLLKLHIPFNFEVFIHFNYLFIF